jgi:hypothetical protein
MRKISCRNIQYTFGGNSAYQLSGQQHFEWKECDEIANVFSVGDCLLMMTHHNDTEALTKTLHTDTVNNGLHVFTTTLHNLKMS